MNPLSLAGIAAIAFAAPTASGADALHALFLKLGFSRTKRHATRAVDLYEQHDIRLLLDREPAGFSASFAQTHGPSIPAMAWWVSDATEAHAEALRRGAHDVRADSPFAEFPAIYGIGGSLLHLIDDRAWFDRAFVPHPAAVHVPDRGFLLVDHLTNNVQKGTMGDWKRFYQDVLGFTEVRYFDIRGEQTGLTSHALRSPCGTFCIPINEGSESKSQIEEYLREYRGAGVQHIAFLTEDLLESLHGLAETGVRTLDIDAEYYRTVFDRVPDVREDHPAIEALSVLVDGDSDGYLLQIFTQNVIGPIFFEFIQRNNHLSFGEGNFSALFRSIERDQERRGVL